MQKIDLHQDLISSFADNISSFQQKIEIIPEGSTNHGGFQNYKDADLQITRASIRPYIIESDKNNPNKKIIKYSNKKLIQDRKNYEQLRKENNIHIILNSEDLEHTKYLDYKLNLIYQLKWADGIQTIDDFKKLQKAGIRSVQPVREFNNKIANCHRSPQWWLTEFWKEILEYLDQNKIIIDTANMNHQSMIETYQFTRKPIMNSHTNVLALHQNSRNVTDEFLELIQKSEWLIWLSITSEYITWNEKIATIHDYIAQIKYVKERVGDDHIAFGSNYHGIYFKKVVQGLENISSLSSLEQEVVNNFWYKFATKFFRENAYRFIAQTL